MRRVVGKLGMDHSGVVGHGKLLQKDKTESAKSGQSGEICSLRQFGEFEKGKNVQFAIKTYIGSKRRILWIKEGS